MATKSDKNRSVSTVANATDLKNRLSSAALAFRGYNVTNLGRSAELLAHRAYGQIVKQKLDEASEICSEAFGKKVDLVTRVRRGRETTLRSYSEAVSLVMAMEIAQIRLLKEFFNISHTQCKFALGYSLGEITAVVCSGIFSFHDALKIPLAVAKDCAQLAKNVTMGILFSRGSALDLDQVQRLCLRITSEGKGVIGVSTYLSPNSLLLLGQHKTIDRFRKAMKDVFPDKTYLRKNENHWPPLHTPIVWEKNVPSRCGVMLHTVGGGFEEPRPPILSMVTGKQSYNDFNSRDILRRWVDHPQRLWDVIYETLSTGIETIIHVGPEPNLIPSTYRRLSENVQDQVSGSIGLRAMAGMARRPWLAALLPSSAALLRAPIIEQVILEDWLLAQNVP